MILMIEQVRETKERRESRGFNLNMFEVDLIDTIESQSTQIEQLQESNKVLFGRIITKDLEIEQLQAQVEKCKSEMAKIPYRCGWYEGIGLECTNKDPHKVNYCPCAICPRHKTPEATEKNSAI
jgi:hypothetical protein